jgi:serine/threonine protein kinase
MPAEEEPLLDVAMAVADGEKVDWASVHSSASGHDAPALEQLRVIAEIAAVHRERPEGASGTAPMAAAPARATRPDPSGPRWGPLLVLEKLGAGSFGEVFRAWDTTLDREVALKLLRARGRPSDSITREGQLLARVSHANVMAVYGAQEIDGRIGIWGEFLRGRTLSQIVRQEGPLSADEATVVGESLCRALAAAHRAGLLHRDVKAQNVMRENGGRIVLMDFGLGRDLNDAGGPDLAGTPAYLAPELLRGERASARSDLYSLGVLLFHLVTGSFPVVGKSLDDLTARHARGERQRLQDLRPDLPAAFVQVVERATAADPGQRFDSSGAMQAALAGTSRPLEASAAEAPGWRGLLSAWGLAALAAGALAGLGLASVLRRPEPPPLPVLFPLSPPPGTRFSDSTRDPGTVSPDGQHVVFGATDTKTGVGQLWLYSMKTMTASPLPQSVSGAQTFWAPDSRSLGFFTADGLQRITVDGVRADTVAAATESRGASWSREGTILFAQGPHSGLYRVPTSGQAAKAVPVVEPQAARGELGYMWPQFLADGQRFVFFVASNDDNVRGLYLGSLRGETPTRLVACDAGGTVAGDRLLFVRDGNLAAQRFDPDRRTVIGEARTLAERVATTFDYRSAVSASDNGVLVYLPALPTELRWYDRTGHASAALALPAGRYRAPALSRDGRYLAAQRYRDTVSEIAVFDLQREEAVANVIRGGVDADEQHSPLTLNPLWEPGPTSRLTYAASDQGQLDLYSRSIEGGDTPSLLYASPNEKQPNDWSPDGRFLAFTELSPAGSYDLWILPRGATPYPLVHSPADEGAGHFSPDGRQIAYVSTESGHVEVWVRDFPGGKTAAMVSSAGGLDPSWISETELTFLDRAGRLMIARRPPPGHPWQPEPLAQTRVVTPGASRNNYAWSPDRRRVLMVEPADTDTHPRVWIHWDSSTDN